jgi:hypothetical protein
MTLSEDAESSRVAPRTGGEMDWSSIVGDWDRDSWMEEHGEWASGPRAVGERVMHLRFIPAKADPGLSAAAEAAASFFSTGVTREKVEGFRGNLVEAGMVARKSQVPGFVVLDWRQP